MAYTVTFIIFPYYSKHSNLLHSKLMHRKKNILLKLLRFMQLNKEVG